MSEEQKPMPETELDEALDFARNNPSRPNDFYDSLLNAEVMLPVQITGKTEPTWQRATMKDRFHPCFIPKGEIKAVPIFDQLERMQGWAQQRTFDYVQVRCHLLLQILGDKVGLVLNPGTGFSHSLSPETLDKLRKAMKPITPQ